MRPFDGTVNVGIREKETNKLVAVYPEKIQGDHNEVEEKVKFWFYQQSCGAEDMLRNCYVDSLTEKEIQNFKLQ